MSRKNTSAKAEKAAAEPIVVVPAEPTRLASRTREETWPIGRIKPYERNAREHSQTQIDQIRASYREFGEVQRVVVDEAGELIAGHGRHQALLQENVADVRVAIAIDWTEDQKRRFRLIDNQLGLTSSWNEKLLKAEILELNGLGVDVGQLGFEPGRIAGLLHVAPAGLTEPDMAPDLPPAPTSARGVFGRGDYHFQHEPAFYAVQNGADEHWHFVPEHEVASYTVRDGKPGHYEGGRKQSTVWNIEHIKSETGHGTQKPVEAMRRPIENNSQPGEAVYEPFSGSGTTIIAGEITGRRILAIELNPLYVDVGVLRWQAFTGIEATLEGDGRTFSEIRDARALERAAAEASNERISA